MQISTEMKIKIKEKGKIRHLFLKFPKKRGTYDNIPYAMTKIIFWFLANFKELLPYHIILAAIKYDSTEGMKIMQYIREGYKNGNK